MRDSILKGNKVLSTRKIKDVSGITVTVEPDKVASNPTTLYSRCSPNIDWNWHWWGYSHEFTPCETEGFIDYLNMIAQGSGVVGGVSSYWFPPLGPLGALYASYFGLVAARMEANNYGNGVYVGITWAAVFNVSPL